MLTERGAVAVTPERRDTGPSTLTLCSLAHGAIGPSDAGDLARRPYWWDAAPPSEELQAFPPVVDVAIVGSGYTGLSAALTLLRRGRTVAVFEAGPLGHGASTRNGGQVGSGNQKFRVKDLIALRGEDLAVRLLREGGAMLDYIEQVVRQENIACHFTRAGRFRGATRPEHYDAMARDMEDLHRLTGVEYFAVPKSEQHKEIGTERFFGGVVLPNDAAIHPGLFHSGLMGRVRAAGGRLLAHCEVRSLERAGGGFRISSARGETQARNVIIATNGYTGGLAPFLKRRIVPVPSAIIATAPIPRDLLASLMPTQRVYGNSNRAFSYFRKAPAEDRILWGGRVGRFAPANAPTAFAHLARDLLAHFPQLEKFGVTHAWTGQIGYTFDTHPHLGESPDGLHYAMGYCGTGVSRSTYFGHKIALRVLGDPEGRTAFDEISFPSHPFEFAARATVPAVELIYRFRDKFNV